MYSVTHSVVGVVIVTATIGVRQGSPTSCLLFIIFVNYLIALIKNGCDVDGIFVWLLTFVLMDDTVLLSTTRQGMQRKLTLLNGYCRDYGMGVNNVKTKFFALNCLPEEKGQLIVEQTVFLPQTGHCRQL